ncbi:MAG: DUF4126 domain-containing protein [Gammaproteobacteria bacterium]|nr:DUF4126 domain-containing protein [Gammaproteobacteria bacterium]
METVQLIALTLGVAWASGINLYAAVLVLGYFGSTGDLTLPPGLELLSDPMVMAAAGLMYMVEFFADKTPGVDTGWDLIHTFVRIPAGALLAAGMVEGLDVSEATQFAAFLVGGSLAAASHITKTGTRALINTSPEPVTNWTASITEDIAVVGGLWVSLNYPWLFLVALVFFLLAVIWLLPRIWQALKRIFQTIGRLLGGRSGEQESPRISSRKDILSSLYNDAKKNS